MTSSRDDGPPALASMWRLCKLGYSHEPGLLSFAFVMSLLAAVPDAMLALLLKFLADGVVAGDRQLILLAVLGMAVAVTLTWLMRVATARVTRSFRDKVTIALETHVAGLQASVSTIEHQERRDFLDRLAILRNHVFVLDHMYMSLFSTAGWIVRLGLTVALLMSIHPVLALLLLFAVPTVVSSSWRPAVERETEEANAIHQRLAVHLFTVATTAAPGKEVRVTGIGPELVRRRRHEWNRWYGPTSAVRWSSAAWHSLAWGVFGSAYVGAIVFVASGLQASPGNVLLVLAAGGRLSAYVAASMREIGFIRGVWLDGARRLAWLEDYAAAMQVDADQPAPDSLTDGIRLDKVSFAYPGTDTLVLDDVSLHLPAGRVVAVVGENGAGKSTLVKLLCKMYEPTSGEILVDTMPLHRISGTAWRAKVSGAFQDFFRFEFAARTSVGLGNLPDVEDDTAVLTALRQGGCRRGRDPVGVRARHPARTDVARRRRRQLRPVAEARPCPRLHARRAAAAGARRADGCPRRRDRARAVQPVCRGRPGRFPRRRHDLGVASLQHRADGRPDRRAPGVGGVPGRQPRGVDAGRRAVRRAVLDPSPFLSGVTAAGPVLVTAVTFFVTLTLMRR
ncbi:MAG: ABC transporter ATP-binding protein [Nocardioidaceae bacterium]